ncbi:MAG TPA: NADH-quinone oxidoreductase subunit J, partial [Pirellulaceae bacterium]
AGAEFVGAMQIMIYVGGTLVLLVFGVMLTAQASFISMKTAAGEWIVAAIVGGSLFFLLLQSAFSVPQWRAVRGDQDQLVAAESKVEAPLGLGLLGIAIPHSQDSDYRSGYLLPFEIVSVHLLVVLVGAAYLARSRYRVVSARPSASPGP